MPASRAPKRRRRWASSAWRRCADACCPAISSIGSLPPMSQPSCSWRRSFAFLASAHGALPTIGVTLLGLGLGTEIDLIAFLVSRYFGQRSFGQLYGYCFMAFGFGSSGGRFLGGYAYDLAHSYNPALIGASIALVISVVLVNCLGPYLYPVRREAEPELAAQPAVP